MSYYRITYVVYQDPKSHIHTYIIKSTIVYASSMAEITGWIEQGDTISGVAGRTIGMDELIAIEKVGFSRTIG